MPKLKADLKPLIKGEISDARKVLQKYSRDASLFEIAPQLVVAPKDEDDLKQLVHYVNIHPEQKLSLTMRSAGTDMSGGPLNSGIIVDMLAHFNHIKDINGKSIVTQPGVYYRDLDKETSRHHLLLPCYPASRELCTVGGMASNNSGGEKSLTYGKTENFVQKLKVILSDGNEYTFGPLSGAKLKQKMAQNTFEGQIYHKLFTLINDNYEALQAAKPHVTKNSAGYYLWNVWDKEKDIFDVTKLLVGSQGTLGIITEITFRLVTPKRHSRLLVIFMRDLAPLGEIVNKVLAFKPEAFESYDSHTLNLALRFLPEIARQIGPKKLLPLFFQFLPEFSMVIESGGEPQLVLLAEFTGDSDAETLKQAQAAQVELAGLPIKTRVTSSGMEMQKYWLIRRESFNLLRHHVRGKHTAPFIDDIVVRPEQLPQFLPELDKVMSKYKLIYTIAGHVGDANFHIIPLMDFSNPETKEIIPELSKKVYDLVLKYHGSITGEHNDGLIRSPYLPQMYGKEIYHLFEETKRIFDPHNIFNPGKKIGGSLEENLEHMTSNM